ncbi:unnamed protein product [Dicrocoelium dendriticum]|nr:unnamed protein product [Dicrocoelium dendriticum]
MRLRAENGVLVQRLARLEEECSSMAERLIQSQLVRAQEAETMLALRCDLSVLKRTMAENDVHRSSLNANGGFAIVNGDFATSIMNSSDTTALDPADPVQKGVDLPLETSTSTSVANSFGHSAVSVSDESTSVCPPLSPPDVKHVSDTKVLEAIPDPARGVVGSATQDDLRDTLPRQQHFFRNRMPSRENAPTTTDVCHLYTDLSMCCVREAEARTELLDLKARYYALEQVIAYNFLPLQFGPKVWAYHVSVCS